MTTNTTTNATPTPITLEDLRARLEETAQKHVGIDEAYTAQRLAACLNKDADETRLTLRFWHNAQKAIRRKRAAWTYDGNDDVELDSICNQALLYNAETLADICNRDKGARPVMWFDVHSIFFNVF